MLLVNEHEHQVFDDTDTNVEEDIFHELIEGSPHLCLTVRSPENIAGLFEGKSVITLET